jgi:hypothetical protein
MATEPDQIRSQIEVTRSNLASNVDQLADRTSPKRIMNRGWRKMSDKMHAISDTVMGAPSSAASSVKEVASDAAEAVRDTPRAAAEQTRGNPLAAGLIAFGAGLLAAAVLPESEAERRLSRQLADSELAERVSEPLKESAGQVGRDLGEEVKGTGAQLADSAKEHASQAMEDVKTTVGNR